MASRVLLLIALALSACSSVPPNLFTPLPDPAPGHVELHYLGNGGWLITKGTHKVATAPFVTNPQVLTLFFPREPNATLIREVIPPMHDVGIMLVGHGHYDHAMDLPAVHEQKAPATKIYGSATVVNTLAAVPRLRPHLVPIAGAAVARADRPGTWLPSATSEVRFMAVESSHAPHVDGVKLLPSSNVDTPQTKLPCCPFWWKEGQTYAFIIDFLKESKVVFRIYYQDSAPTEGMGLPPAFAGSDDAPVDVAILCVASFARVTGHPEAILGRLRPRHIIGGHWEDFLLWPSRDPMRPVVGTDLEAFHRRAKSAAPGRPIYLPKPGRTVYIPVQ